MYEAGQFAKNLKWLREEAGLTQKEVAEKAGCAVSSIARLESGGGSEPSMFYLDVLADFFGVTMDELAGRKELPKGKTSTMLRRVHQYRIKHPQSENEESVAFYAGIEAAERWE